MPTRPAQDVADAVLAACRAFAGGDLPDDCAIVVLRRRVNLSSGRGRPPARDRAPRRSRARTREHARLAAGGSRRRRRPRRVRHLARARARPLARRAARRASSRSTRRSSSSAAHDVAAAPRREAARLRGRRCSRRSAATGSSDRAYVSTAFARHRAADRGRSRPAPPSRSATRATASASRGSAGRAPLTRAGAAALRQAMPLRMPLLLRWARANALSLHHTLCSRAAVVGRAPARRACARLDGERSGRRAAPRRRRRRRDRLRRPGMVVETLATLLAQ